MNTHIGRLDRRHFWVAVLSLFVLRYIINTYVDPFIARHLLNALTFLWLLVIITRFHDFNLSSWVSVPVWIGLCIAWPLTYTFEVVRALRTGPVSADAATIVERIPTEIILQMLGPGLLLYVIAGFIPGRSGDNKYGPPDQGWNGLSPVKTFSANDAMPRSESKEELPSQSFGRRQTI